ncbi:MAG: hypothetical protein NTX48_14540 [Planctomycetales bacterium]|nr:hypothetical protein [Planctomycetales bacterium]
MTQRKRSCAFGWQHVLRQAILKLMPAGKLAEYFDPQMGRPTKELYSMAGLLFIMEFRNWTHEEAAMHTCSTLMRSMH